jgi:zinc transporter ZupT
MTATIGQAALLLAAVSALGALLPLHRRWSERGLHVFVAIATGVFLGTIFLHLLPELAAATARDADTDAGGSSGHAVALLPWWAALVGLVLLFVLEKVWLGRRRRGDGARGDPHDVVCFATFIGLSVHSFVTGLGFSGVVTEPALLWPLVTSVAVHKAGEGFSLATVMRLAHLPTPRALALLAVFCIATPVGLLIGAQLATGDSAARVTPLLTGLACGTFLYVAVADLLPEVFHGARDGAPRIVGLLVGIGVAAVGFAGIG